MSSSSCRVLGALVAALAVGACSAAATEAAFPGRNGRIMFVSLGLGNQPAGLKTMAADGSDSRVIWVGSVSHASWSPDGSKIVFQFGASKDAEIRVINAEGGGERTLAADPESDRSPAWSPDGRQVLYERIETIGTRKHAIPYVVGVDGSDPTRLPMPIPCAGSLGSCEPHPVWSAAGRIALASDRSGSQEIWSMNPDGSDPRQLTSAPGRYLSMDWSPDGSRLVLTRMDPSGAMRLFVVNADGSGLTDLTSTLGGYRLSLDVGYAAWSPDGARIAIGSALGWTAAGRADIYSMNPDGSNMARLTTDGTSIAPSWQPVIPPAGTPGLPPDPRLKIASKAARMSRRGDVRVAVTCVRAGAGGVCSGSLRLATAKRVSCRRSKPRRVTLGLAPFRIEPGRNARVRVRLAARNRRLVTCLRRVRVRATAGVPRPAGGVASFASSFLLRAP